MQGLGTQAYVARPWIRFAVPHSFITTLPLPPAEQIFFHNLCSSARVHRYSFAHSHFILFVQETWS